MKIVGRMGALLLGVLAFIVGLIADFFQSTIKHIFEPQHTSHGFYGLLLLIVGLVGAIMALGRPVVSAVLMVIAAVGFVLLVGVGPGIAPGIIFLLAAVLAYIDRSTAGARA